jgi:hypothetical protein
MADLLQLTNKGVPLQKRYDQFVLWINEQTNNVPELLANSLGVDVSVVDVFFELGNLDVEEFSLIDENNIDIDELFLIVRTRKEVRLEAYKNASVLLSGKQPLKAIREFIDKQMFGSQEDLIKRVSADGWSCINKYIKQRNIVNGTITKSFRSFLYRVSKFKKENRELSSAMMDWLIRAIIHDDANNLGVFTNSALKKEFSDDYELLGKIIVVVRDQADVEKP